jgi:hypothetical protein
LDCGEFICCTAEGGKCCRRLLVGIGCGIGDVKVQQNNISGFVLDSVIGLVGEVEGSAAWTWITEKVINKGWAKEVEEC